MSRVLRPHLPPHALEKGCGARGAARRHQKVNLGGVGAGLTRSAAAPVPNHCSLQFWAGRTCMREAGASYASLPPFLPCSATQVTAQKHSGPHSGGSARKPCAYRLPLPLQRSGVSPRCLRGAGCCPKPCRTGGWLRPGRQLERRLSVSGSLPFALPRSRWPACWTCRTSCSCT